MRTPRFWNQPPPTPLARLLQPVGGIYGAATAARMRQAGKRATIPVICVGNLTAGGAGKTPTVIALGAYLAQKGLQPIVLSRGYGGSLAGPIQVDPGFHMAAQVGDEPLLLAQSLPVIVAKNRVAGAQLAARIGRVILMDDGLQNPALTKDITIAVIDGASGFGNGLCVPAGPLRAPPGFQWPFIDHVVVIGTGAPGAAACAAARDAGKPIWQAALAPDADIAAQLAGANVLAMSGIGQPDKFRATLESVGAVIVGERRFADHAIYSPKIVHEAARAAHELDAVTVTTQKDFVKLAGLWQQEKHGPLIVLPVSLQLTDADQFYAQIETRLGEIIDATAS
jgi:tetraacyldisaccharide 4'-kinase